MGDSERGVLMLNNLLPFAKNDRCSIFVTNLEFVPGAEI